MLSSTLLEAILSRGFRTPMPQPDTRVPAVGTSMNFASVVGGLAASCVVAAAMSQAIV